MDAKTAYEARRSAIEDLKALVDEVGEREFSAEEQESYDRINSDIDRFDGLVERALKAHELDKRSAEVEEVLGHGAPEEREQVSQIEREARQLFGLQPGQSVEFSAPAAQLNRRDLLAGTATDGAELVPTSLFGSLYAELREGATSMFSLGRNIVTASGEAMDFPRVTSFSSASLVSEAAAISESDPQFATVTLDAYKYGLAVQVSPELEQDNAVAGALPWVVEQAVDGIRRGVGAHLITGTGTGQPNGIDNGSNVLTTAAIAAVTADELIDAYHDVKTGYRANGTWIFKDSTVKEIRQLKDGDSQYLWRPGIAAGMPDTLLGRPVVTDDNLPAMATGVGFGIFGDIQKGYLVRIVSSIRAERSVEYAFLNDLVTWRFLGRFDGDIIDNNAFTVLTNA